MLRCFHVVEAKKERRFSTHVRNLLKGDIPLDVLFDTDTFVNYANDAMAQYENTTSELTDPSSKHVSNPCAKTEVYGDVRKIWKTFALRGAQLVVCQFPPPILYNSI